MTYWSPIYAYARSRGARRAEAEDLTQSFFQHMLRTDFFSKANVNRGRFRDFLLQSFRNHWSTARKRESAERRGGKVGFIPLKWIDGGEGETCYEATWYEGATPEAVYDREWANRTLQAAMARLRKESDAAGRGDWFRALEPYLDDFAGHQGYADEIAQRLDKKPAAVRQAMKRMRRRFGIILREVIAETLCDVSAGQVDEELQALQASLSGFNQR